MNEVQISGLLRQDLKTAKQFLGVFAADEVQHISPKQYPLMFVANTAPRSHPGKHWVAFHYIKRNHVEFFDSLGKKPELYGFQYKHYTYNSHTLQSHDSSVCGFYVIYYMLCKANGYSMDEIISNFAENRDANDNAVVSFVQNINTM